MSHMPLAPDCPVVSAWGTKKLNKTWRHGLWILTRKRLREWRDQEERLHVMNYVSRVKHDLRPRGQTAIRRAAQYLAARPLLKKWKRDRRLGRAPKVKECKKLHRRYVAYMKYLWNLDKKPQILHSWHGGRRG